MAGLQLPANFLDVLIDELGGAAAVVEMTGRKGRVVKQVRLWIMLHCICPETDFVTLWVTNPP